VIRLARELADRALVRDVISDMTDKVVVRHVPPAQPMMVHTICLETIEWGSFGYQQADGMDYPLNPPPEAYAKPGKYQNADPAAFKPSPQQPVAQQPSSAQPSSRQPSRQPSAQPGKIVQGTAGMGATSGV
jgi:hypothetical protein